MSISVVTGANRGIGLELTKQLAARGASVVAVCRKSSPELDALGVRVESGVDVSKPESVVALAKRLEPIELLINNAGVLRADSLSDATPATVLEQFQVNALGPLLVTQALAPLMQKGAKLALVTSRMGSIADNTSGGYYGYRMSKAALNACGKSLALDLAPRGIAVIILHPGFVRTEMTGNNGLVDSKESAAGLLAQIDALTPDSTGSFRHMNGDALPW